MKKQVLHLSLAAGLVVVGIVASLVIIPALVSRHYDGKVVGGIHLEEKDADVEGYQYNLTMDEKLYLLSNALSNRILPQSDYFAAIRWQDSLAGQTQSYAFQPIYKDSEYNSETRAAALAALKEELKRLSGLGILPDLDFDPDDGTYEATLFSAIDILEPKKSVTVWQINFSGVKPEQGLVDCIMDAQTHKLYCFSIRAQKTWAQYNADDAVRLWAEYLDTSEPQPFVPDNPLVEDASHYSKYTVKRTGNDKTVVTVGYYEGIQEFFVRITR